MVARPRLSVALSSVLFFHHLLLLALASPSPPLAATRNGTYEGIHLASFHQHLFLGIPYAQSTADHNRFRIPQSLNASWPDTRPAQQYGHACPDHTPEDDALWGMSEDCLNINIVRPAAAHRDESLPVLFWIHGGSYQVGTAGLDRYNLSYIVDRSVHIGRPILAASINYRKAGWGFMNSVELHGSGNLNLGLRDMRLALQWVQENIRAFGGDPSRVTIWGESAGSFAVGQLLMSYGGRDDGLFHRSIQESGSVATAWYNSSERYQPLFDRLVATLGCADAVDKLDCLRGVPYETVYRAMSSQAPSPGYYPTVDGDILPNFPTELLRTGRFVHVPHLYGSNSDEGTDNAPSWPRDRQINTDDDLFRFLTQKTGFDFPDATVRRIMELYPDDPARGIPLGTGAERFPDRGWMYKRVAAIMGDVFYHAPRLADARAYAKRNPGKTFVYRFNTRPWVTSVAGLVGDGGDRESGDHVDVYCEPDHHEKQVCAQMAPAYLGVAHATELAFVFRNPDWLGPWPSYRRLSDRMSDMWIHFAHDGDPNGPDQEDDEEKKTWRGLRTQGVGGYTTTATDPPTGLIRNTRPGAVRWPPYDSRDEGANFVFQTEAQGGLYVESDAYRLEGREYLTSWARRRHV